MASGSSPIPPIETSTKDNPSCSQPRSKPRDRLSGLAGPFRLLLSPHILSLDKHYLHSRSWLRVPAPSTDTLSHPSSNTSLIPLLLTNLLAAPIPFPIPNVEWVLTSPDNRPRLWWVHYVLASPTDHPRGTETGISKSRREVRVPSPVRPHVGHYRPATP